MYQWTFSLDYHTKQWFSSLKSDLPQCYLVVGAVRDHLLSRTACSFRPGGPNSKEALARFCQRAYEI